MCDLLLSACRHYAFCGTRRAAGADRQAGIKCFLPADWWRGCGGRMRRRNREHMGQRVHPSVCEAGTRHQGVGAQLDLCSRIQNIIIHIHSCKKPKTFFPVANQEDKSQHLFLFTHLFIKFQYGTPFPFFLLYLWPNSSLSNSYFTCSNPSSTP